MKFRMVMYTDSANPTLPGNFCGNVNWMNPAIVKISDFWNSKMTDTFLADRTIGHAFGMMCRLSVCLSSVTFCIVAKRYVLAKKCLKEWIGNQGQKVRFFGSPPYFYLWFRRYGHRDGRFCLIFARTAQWSVLDGTDGLSSSKPYFRHISTSGFAATAP